MPANSPEEVHQLFAAAFAEANLDALMSLYEPHATLAPAPGTWVNGQAAIREALNGFLLQKPEFKMKAGKVIQSGESLC